MLFQATIASSLGYCSDFLIGFSTSSIALLQSAVHLIVQLLIPNVNEAMLLLKERKTKRCGISGCVFVCVHMYVCEKCFSLSSHMASFREGVPLK